MSRPKRCAVVLLRLLLLAGLAAGHVEELNAHGTEARRVVALQRFLARVRVEAAGNRHLEIVKRASIRAPLASSAGMEGLGVAGLVAGCYDLVRLRRCPRTQQTSG